MVDIKQKKLSLFKIPDKPVDGFVVYYWYLSISDIWVYIKEMKATYYINTSYEEYEPGSKGGAPLIDDWMISEKSVRGHWNGKGRICGWSDILTWSDEVLKNTFTTREEAFKEAVRRFDNYIRHAEKRIAEMKQMREELRDGKDSH